MTADQSPLVDKAPAVTTKTPRIVIIGAGVSGIGSAIKLREAGFHDLRIVEKSDSFGGTWHDNSYPGASCDVPAHLYSLSFAPNPNWSVHFAGQPEILAHFRSVAAEHHLSDITSFNTEIVSAEWRHETAEWHLHTATGDEIVANVVISGLGQLNRPKIPAIEGLQSFEGTKFHSARWNHDHDLTGRRVAVIGTGASAIQFVPEVAKQVGHLDLYQRSPNWVLPRVNEPYSEGRKRAFRRVPGARLLHRAAIWARFEGLVGPVFNSGSVPNKKATEAAMKFLASSVPDDDLRAKLTPDYPIGCTRILGSSSWYPTLQQSNVEVITSGIERIVADGIIDTEGRHREVDTIIFGTGFRTTEFLSPINFRGIHGRSLHESWGDGAEAYMGTITAGFPNLFMLYGPNTNLGHNSIIFMIEQQLRYVVKLLDEMKALDLVAIEPRPEAQAIYNEWVQEKMRKRVWVADCSSWYKNESGKVVNNWPTSTVEYWRKCRRPDFDAFTGYRRPT